MPFLKKQTPVTISLPPSHFPPEFQRYWNEVVDAQAIRREMAALLLADLRERGPDWPTERYETLHRILGDNQ